VLNFQSEYDSTSFKGVSVGCPYPQRKYTFFKHCKTLEARSRQVQLGKIVTSKRHDRKFVYNYSAMVTWHVLLLLRKLSNTLDFDRVNELLTEILRDDRKFVSGLSISNGGFQLITRTQLPNPFVLPQKQNRSF